MKINLLLTAFALPCLALAQINVSGTVNDKANEKLGQTIDGVWNAGSKAKNKNQSSGSDSSKSSGQQSGDQQQQQQQQSSGDQQPAQAAPTVKTYQNYDFVPGSQLVFADDFSSDMDGEFPAHWELKSGQAVVNKIDNKPAFCLTDGNYVVVYPRVTPNSYLDPNSWTIEADCYFAEGDFGLIFFFQTGDMEKMQVFIGPAEASCTFPEKEGEDYGGSNSLTGSLTQDAHDHFAGRWHHYAIGYKNEQVKVYVDQARVLVVPNCHCKPTSMQMGGIGSQDNALKFTNVRIANGGDQNMLNTLNTNGKIVSYGVTFDVGKSDIRPESMGTLNEIAKMMKDNPTLKLEIGGHTDSDGDDASNLKLSQARADAVRNQLIAMGIDGARLTAKGYGETKPVSDNTSFEGKAKNRRVEFTKI